MKFNQIFWFSLTLVGVVFLIYYPVFSFGFTFLDDHVQIVENPFIKTIDFTSIKEIFSNFFVGMYQPATTLMYAIVHSIFGLNPKAFHAILILFHAANSVLVFRLLRFFLKSASLSFLLSAIFACHPMQVESVAWVSAYSNLLFTFFSLLSCYYYLNVSGTGKKQSYIFSFLFFVLACLSKSAAVVLPLLFICFDLLNKKFRIKNILSQSPFFIVSIVIGLVTIIGRNSAEHLSDLSLSFNLFERLFLVSHSVLFYPLSFLAPFKLSAFYPYPELQNGSLPLFYYLSLPIVLIGLAFLYWKRSNKFLLLGSAWFFVGIILIVQIIPVGNQITTDRYIYFPSIGLLLILGAILQNHFQKKYLKILFLIPFILAIMSFQRTKIWENDKTLWESVLQTHPNVSQAHNNLGSYALTQKNNQLAFNHFNQAIRLQPNYADAYSNRGNLYALAGNSEAAIKDYNKAIILEPHADAYFNRANEFSKLNKLKESISDYNKSIELAPKADSYTNRAFTYLKVKNFEMARKDLKMAQNLNPKFARAYFLEGILEQNTGNVQAACSAFLKAANLGEKNAKEAYTQLCR